MPPLLDMELLQEWKKDKMANLTTVSLQEYVLHVGGELPIIPRERFSMLLRKKPRLIHGFENRRTLSVVI
jgi:hypothetical protein